MFHNLIKKPLSSQDLVDELSLYQDDLVLIIGSCRYNPHPLSVQEILSEVNNHIVMHSKKLSEKKFYNAIGFRKFLYTVAKSFVRWTCQGGKQPREISYIKRKADYNINSHSGSTHIFEFVCNNLGEDDEYHLHKDSFEKYRNIYSWILEYSNFLNDYQKEILKFYWSGKNVNEIGKMLGVTHQAVSSCIRDSIIKIKHYIIFPEHGCCENHIVKGNQSIQKLFKKH
jgi:hypothetical protein